MKWNTALLFGIIAVAAIALFLYSGIGTHPQSTVALVYDSGAGAYSQSIVVASNGSQTDITNDAVKYGSGQIDKIVADIHCDVNFTVHNAQANDVYKITFTVTYGSATYGPNGITLYTYALGSVTDQMSYTVTLSGSQFTSTNSKIVSADSLSNLFGRKYVRCYDLLTAIDTQPWGTSWTLSVPVSISVQYSINGQNSQPAPASNIVGKATVTVSGGATTADIIVTTATISTQYVALNIFAH